MTLHCIVADDEPLARERIRDLIAPHDVFKIIAECSNGVEAVRAITRHDPDLVFLDIQMPDLDGFDVLAEIGEENMPAVIFTTAFHHFASHAFEAGAIDYLLKPFGRQRFNLALDRAAERLQRQRLCEMARDVRQLLRLSEPQPSYPDRLSVRGSGVVHFIRPDQIGWIEAARNYVSIHTRDDTFSMRETLSSLQNKLDPQRFLRIHRSIIVNLDRIRKLETPGSETIAVLDDGTRLPISRACRHGKIRDLLC